MEQTNIRDRQSSQTPRTSAGSRSAAPKPLSFIDTWQPHQNIYPRHQVATVILVAGLAAALIFPAGHTFSLLGIFIFAVAAAWFLLSNKLSASPIKLIRSLSLNADTNNASAEARVNELIEAMIASGFIDSKTRPYKQDVSLTAIDTEIDDPWTFILRERQEGRITLKDVQSKLEKLAPKISNGYRDAEMILVEPTQKSNHIFKILVYFNQNTSSFKEGWDINSAMKRNDKLKNDISEEEKMDKFNQTFTYPSKE